MMSILLWKK